MSSRHLLLLNKRDRMSATQQDELVLLEKVLMRLATAETDEALTSAVNKFLPPCLLKLSSQQEGVRMKVMELLVHINKRIKSNPRILLPLDALLVQYQDPSATSFVTNFTIIYIKMGFPRLPAEKQAELVPAVLSSIDGKPSSHQESLLLMIIPILGNVVAPDNPEKKKVFLGLNEKPQIAQLLNSFLLDYLLLPYGSHPSLQSAEDREDPEASSSSAWLHPGLCETSWKRVAGETPVKAEELEKNKVKILKFLGMGLIEEAEIAIHLVVGAADTRHSVAGQAETEMRKFSGVLDWNNGSVVSKIYSLFLGTLVLKEKPAPKPENRRVPANTRIRLKLMPYLLKSREAAVQFPACIQVIFDLLFGTTGNTNAKLKLMAVNFIHHVIYNCPAQRLGAIGAVLLSALNRLVAEENDNPKLRASCYVAIGKLGLKVPQLVNKDVTMIQTFFEAMAREDQETQLSVQEAMSLMAPSFKSMEKGNMGFVEALLATYIEKDEPQVRLVAVQYAGEIFPQNHEASRYILLLGAGDAKEEVGIQARSHLYRTLNKLRQQSDQRFRRPKDEEVVVQREEMLPGFVSMLRYVLDKAAIRIKTQERYVVGDKVLAFNPGVYSEVLNFLRNCLLNSAGIVPAADSLAQPEFGAPAVTKYLGGLADKSGSDKSLVVKFLEFAETFLRGTVAAPQANAMLQVVGCTLKFTAHTMVGKIGFFKGLLDNTREDIRLTVAQLYGIVAAEMGDADFEKAVTDLARSFKEKSLEFQHGTVVALGYSFGRKVLCLRMSSSSEKCQTWESYKTMTELIIGQLASPQALMLGAACFALAELGRCGPLPLPSENKSEEDAKSKLGLVKRLLALLKSGQTSMKVREKAALALGQLCIGDVDFPHRKLVIQEFLEAAQEVKDLELHFTMGEALVYATIGPLSPMGREMWSTAEEDFKPLVPPDASDALIDWVLDELCNKYTMSTHPNVKQASCLWLLAVTKYGKDLPKLQVRLLEIQSAFMSLLGDANDLVQDAASKGLGLVYDSSSEKQQEQMVSSLLSTLTDGKRDVQKVSEETKIFEEGQIGKTPTGENLSTYKELCSLATDLNQPDLVYKFMHLANYNAMWNSRKGAAFGFSTIAAKAGEQMEQHLPKIVPKLYRYQFDPTPKIQESMSSIWNALVPETTKTVDKYLPQILDEIISNLTSNQWRVRESCCTALQDLLRGRLLDDNSLDKLPELWTSVFRVMDDIKESVRLAAAKAADTLSRTCVKMCDANSQGAKSSEAAVAAILPPLLDKGLQSSVPDVRVITIGTIVKVTKNVGGLQLRPHLPLLIPALLESTSEMESKEVNYLSVRMANDPSVQEKLDLARIQAAKSSPMMECVTHVMQFVDSESLDKLIPRLVDLIKGSYGLGTKGTAAHLITTLTHQCPLDLQQHTGKILAAFVAGLTDRNAAVRKTYAVAIGHLIKTARDTSMEKLFFKLRTWYMERDDEASKHAVAFTFEAINQHNPDRMKAHAAQAMPLAFLAMHETDIGSTNEEMRTSDIWAEVWADGTPGSEGGVRLYLKEIMSLLTAAIDSQQWRMKAQVARSMGTVAEKLGDTIPMKEQRQLIVLLINSLAGRTWDGKEAVLAALGDVCCSGKVGLKAILSSGDASQVDSGEGVVSAEVLVACLLRECGKEKHEYRIAAIQVAGKITKELELNCFGQLFEMLFPVIKKEDEAEGEKAEKKEEEDREDNAKTLDLHHAIYECFGSAWPSNDQELQEKFVVQFLTTLRNRVQNTTRKNQLCIVKCLNNLMSSGLKIGEEKKREEVFVEVAKIISSVLVIPKSSQLRTEALSVLGRVIKILAECQSPELVFVFREHVAKSLDDVIKDVSSDAATKSTAREMKVALMAIPAVGPKGEVEEV